MTNTFTISAEDRDRNSAQVIKARGMVQLEGVSATVP